jgi:hypothetical protein
VKIDHAQLADVAAYAITSPAVLPWTPVGCRDDAKISIRHDRSVRIVHAMTPRGA